MTLLSGISVVQGLILAGRACMKDTKAPDDARGDGEACKVPAILVLSGGEVYLLSALGGNSPAFPHLLFPTVLEALGVAVLTLLTAPCDLGRSDGGSDKERYLFATYQARAWKKEAGIRSSRPIGETSMPSHDSCRRYLGPSQWLLSYHRPHASCRILCTMPRVIVGWQRTLLIQSPS